MHCTKLIALIPLLILAGCLSPQIQKIGTVDSVPTSAPSAAAPKYILCSEDPLIAYSAPKSGEADSAANTLDTPATIGADAPQSPARGTIRFHNLTHTSACGK